MRIRSGRYQVLTTWHANLLRGIIGRLSLSRCQLHAEDYFHRAVGPAPAWHNRSRKVVWHLLSRTNSRCRAAVWIYIHGPRSGEFHRRDPNAPYRCKPRPGKPPVRSAPGYRQSNRRRHARAIARLWPLQAQQYGVLSIFVTCSDLLARGTREYWRTSQSNLRVQPQLFADGSLLVTIQQNAMRD